MEGRFLALGLTEQEFFLLALSMRPDLEWDEFHAAWMELEWKMRQLTRGVLLDESASIH